MWITSEHVNSRRFLDSLKKLCVDTKERIDTDFTAYGFANIFHEKVDKIHESTTTYSAAIHTTNGNK